MKFFVNTSEGKRKQVLLLKKKERESMLNNSNQEPMIPLTDEEFAAIRKTIQAEATKLIVDFKSRGLLPAHLIATAGVLLTTLTQIPEIERVVVPITAYSMQAIGGLNREKARKVSIN
jgi:DNA-binding transcriptional regulator/RsmH inhibitor MraZ